MKKGVKVLLFVLGAAVIAAGTYFGADYFHKQELGQLTSQIATLNANLDAIGEIVECYTVSTETFPGQEITEEMVTTQSIPISLKNDTFASKDEIVGLYSKIAITPGTPITRDMVMMENIVDSLREVDISGNRWPIGLQVGDYVDLRITYPRGEDYVVLSHKRVLDIVDQTLKVHMTEEEQTLYQSALVDFYLSRGYGTDLYLTKYIEPGIQEPAVVFYSVPENIASTLQYNPNIVDQAQVAVTGALRANIEESRRKFNDEDDSGALIKAGRDELNSKVNSDFVANETEKEIAEKAENSEQSEGSLITDVSLGVN